MPVVALATTEAVEAVPPDAGVLSPPTRAAWASGLRDLPATTRTPPGRRQGGPPAALERYGLDRFLPTGTGAGGVTGDRSDATGDGPALL